MNKFFSSVMVFLFVVLFFIPVVFASGGSVKLLALSELSNGSQVGVVSDLFLEVKSGSDRVFLETFPLTKIATQISMRFAQQIACKELGVDCGGLDFFYTVRATLGLVGGPSAGAAASVLAASLISGESLNDSVAITGTINSGGIIGPVGGVKQKIEAASRSGVGVVLIPKGSRFLKEGNKSVDLFEYGEKLGVGVVEVATFWDAFDILTGRNHSRSNGDLVVDGKYSDVMRGVAEDICRSVDVAEPVIRSLVINDSKVAQFVNISRIAKSAFKRGEFYTAASFCFRSNLLLRQINLVSQKPARLKILKQIKNVSAELESVRSVLSGRKLSTLSDLQTYMAVDERLVEAREALDNSVLKLDNVVESSNLVGYAGERIGSAVAWSRFFGFGGRRFEINPLHLRDSCMSKISEAEERLSYVKSLIPANFADTRKEIDRAYFDLNNQSFVMCLYRASKAKASSDVVLSLVGVEESQIDSLLDLKLGIVRQELVESQRRGSFPIIGYSYFEYANSLRGIDKSSALLFAEYALELTNIDIYFSQKNSWFVFPFSFSSESVFLFVFGFVSGGVCFWFCRRFFCVNSVVKVVRKKK